MSSNEKNLNVAEELTILNSLLIIEQREIARLFREEEPVNITVKNSNHGEEDFREALFVEYEDEKIVIKLAENGFTDEEHLTM